MLPAGVTKHIYNGNGSTRDWAFTFPIFSTDGSDIKLYKTSIAGVVTEITSNYNVNVAGGLVTYPTIVSGMALLAVGEKITLIRQEPLSQETDWRNKGPFNAETVEAVVDKIVAILQEHDELLSRTMQYSVDQTPDIDEISTFITNIANLQEIETAVGEALAAQLAAEAAQAGAIAAQSAAETAQGLAEDARDAAIVAQEAAEAVAGWTIASQAEAEAGSNNTKLMTPLRAAQAIAALSPASVLMTGDQTVAGIKTFGGGIVIENRTNDTGCTQTGRIWFRTDI